MRDARHYESFARQPAEGSAYAFFVAGFEIEDAARSPLLSDRPVEITDDMHPHDREFYERWNPHLHSTQDRHLKINVERLLSAGVPASRLEDPSDTAVAEILKTLADGQMAACMFLDLEMALRRPRPDIPTHTRVLGSAYFTLGLDAKKVALLLNEDAPRTARGLTRDHIRRARDAYLRGLSRMPALVFDCEIFLSANRLRALDFLRMEAKKHPVLKRYRGAELAQKIDADLNLSNRIDKAAGILEEQGRLLPFTRIASTERERWRF